MSDAFNSRIGEYRSPLFYACFELSRKCGRCRVSGIIELVDQRGNVLSSGLKKAFDMAFDNDSPLMRWATHSALILLHAMPHTFSLYSLK